MDLFISKIKLKEEITQEDVWQLIVSWLKGSQHYGISEVQHFSGEYSEQILNSKKLSVLSTNFNNENILACRFCNEEDNNTWYTSIIFSDKNNDKSICIKLSCESNNYSVMLPKLHKPHIIKMLFEEGYCYDKGIFPIIDRPILLKDKDYDVDLCARILEGKVKTDLPVVFVSYDTYVPGYDVDIDQLAIKLSGVAHVLVEPNKEFTKQLRIKSNDRNPYNGYIGIYFPLTDYHEIISYREHFKNGILDKQSFENSVRYTAQRAAINHANIFDWSWNKLIVELHKSKIKTESENAAKSKQELDAYISAFDAENEQLKEQIGFLRKELDDKNATLELLKRKHSDNNAILLEHKIDSYFIDEIRDCILSVLKYSLSKIQKGSRRYEILKNIIDNNELTCFGKQLYQKIEEALKDKSLPQRRKKLEDCGFELEKGSHDKLFFHDKKYSLTLAGSPSDYRGGQNSLSDILKLIDIYKKF